MRPGTCELRRLHRADSAGDDAKADEADQKLMKAIDVHEVVLDVPKSCEKIIRRQQREHAFARGSRSVFESVGIDVSTAAKGRVLVNIAGSRTTVKRGTQAVIRVIASHRRCRVGDIRLRRIQGQSVDAAGFVEVGPVGEEDLSNCEKPFPWERLTRDQWHLVGRSAKRK